MASGIELMLVGMGTVFTFLTLMVFATGLMSRIVLRLVPSSESEQGSTGTGDDAEVIAAITTALHQHRAKSKASETNRSQ